MLAYTKPRLIWDEANIEHIARHGVLPHEVEEAFQNRFQMLIGMQTRMRERRYEMLGESIDGRVLRIVFAIRALSIRPVTAYTAKRRDRSFYVEAKHAKSL